MYLIFALVTFLLIIGTLLGLFFIIVTSGSFEWPTVLLIAFISIPFLAHKIYKIIIEYSNLDFLYIGHDISSEEEQAWKRISSRLTLGLFLFGIFMGGAWIAFFVSGGPGLQESVPRQGRMVLVDRTAIDLIISYFFYFVGVIFTTLFFAYLSVLIRGWYYSTHTTSRFFNTAALIRNFLLFTLGRMTGMEMSEEKKIKMRMDKPPSPESNEVQARETLGAVNTNDFFDQEVRISKEENASLREEATAVEEKPQKPEGESWVVDNSKSS